MWAWARTVERMIHLNEAWLKWAPLENVTNMDLLGPSMIDQV